MMVLTIHGGNKNTKKKKHQKTLLKKEETKQKCVRYALSNIHDNKFSREKKNQTNNERKMNGPSNHMVQSSGSRRFRKLNAKNYSIHLRN